MHKDWSVYGDEPRYPINKTTYEIDSLKAPVADDSQEGRFIVATTNGQYLYLWRGTFLALVDIMLGNKEGKPVKVVFNRPEGSKVTSVVRV